MNESAFTLSGFHRATANAAGCSGSKSDRKSFFQAFSETLNVWGLREAIKRDF